MAGRLLGRLIATLLGVLLAGWLHGSLAASKQLAWGSGSQTAAEPTSNSVWSQAASRQTVSWIGDLGGGGMGEWKMESPREETGKLPKTKWEKEKKAGLLTF